MSFVILGQKMEDKPLIIPIDQIKADFDKFLTPEHNRRIIFSGPFGIGKTYFLHKFFDDKKEYFPVFLRPINYSLLSNEDVFRFIKYDILCQLVENEKFDIENNFDFNEWDYTKLFLGQNGFAILFNLLKYMPKIGTYVKASQKLGVLVEKFQEGLKGFNDNKELKLLKEFGEHTENHFLFENDGVTEFISQQLEKIVFEQSEGKQKKKVLIIDDLDRLDPEHIFRLFNVFSAHFDQVHYYENGNDNKFGFDKIIFVCDIENIRKIFTHKYGVGVDFSGYADKFYSTYPFFLNNSKYINEYITKSLSIEEIPDEVIEIIRIITSNLFVNGKINLRVIEKLFKTTISPENYMDEERLSIDRLYDIKAKYVNWIRFLSVLKPIFGKYSELITEMRKINEKESITINRITFDKIKEILSSTYSVLNTEKVASLMSMKQNTYGSTFTNEMIVLSFSSTIKINSYISFTKSGSRFVLYDVYVDGVITIPDEINTFGFVDSLIRIISAGLHLNILTE